MKPTWCTIYLLLYFVSFIYNLYMFWTSPSPSSGGTNVFIRHLVLVILYSWLSGVQDAYLQRSETCRGYTWNWRKTRGDKSYPKLVSLTRSDYLSFMLRQLCNYKFTPSLDKIKYFLIRGYVNQILQRWLEAIKRAAKKPQFGFGSQVTTGYQVVIEKLKSLSKSRNSQPSRQPNFSSPTFARPRCYLSPIHSKFQT
jgi:hypothetical protein